MRHTAMSIETTERTDLKLFRAKVNTLSNEELSALVRLLKRQIGDTTEELKVVAEQIAHNNAQRIRERHPA